MQLKLKIEETVSSPVRSTLAPYRVLVFCNKCGELHDTGIAVTLGDGPAAKRSLADFYGENELPKSLAHVMNNSVTCPRTGRQSTQKNNHQIFLVPSSSASLKHVERGIR